MSGKNKPTIEEPRGRCPKYKCKWCKSKNWHHVEDYLKHYIFCNKCGKVSVYFKSCRSDESDDRSQLESGFKWIKAAVEMERKEKHGKKKK